MQLTLARHFNFVMVGAAFLFVVAVVFGAI